MDASAKSHVPKSAYIEFTHLRDVESMIAWHREWTPYLFTLDVAAEVEARLRKEYEAEIQARRIADEEVKTVVSNVLEIEHDDDDEEEENEE